MAFNAPGDSGNELCVRVVFLDSRGHTLTRCCSATVSTLFVERCRLGVIFLRRLHFAVVKLKGLVLG